MLLDRYRQLLTAYVDGELTARQRRHVARLLRRSPEARQLLQQLQEDAHALRHLPRPALPADLTEPVLHTIAERRLTPGRRRAARVSPAASWTGPLIAWAAAAAVLLTLGAASYLYFAASLTDAEKTDLARNQAEEQAPTPEPEPEPEPEPSPPVAVPPNKTPSDAPREKASPKPEIPSPVKRPEIVKRPDVKPNKPSPAPPSTPPKPETVLTGQVEMFQLRKVSDFLPVVFKVRELDRETVRKNLIAELRKDADFRLELPCPNGSRALQRVRNVAKTMQLDLVIEKGAREWIKLQAPGSYSVYIEDLTPEELTRFLQRIGAEDAKLAARKNKKPAESQFDWLVISRMTPQNHKELSTLLGVDPTTTGPSEKGSSAADPRKSLSDTTARQVGQSLAGQGGTPRPEAGKPAAKPPQRVALVLAYNPVRSSPSSDEIKHFLESRKPPRPGTLHVLLVLRG
jgi:hypothetical protein